MFKPLAIIGIVFASFSAAAQTPDKVFLDRLTWTEVRNAIDNGTTTIIVPTGGTEQTGPHIPLGKHNLRMPVGAERIARALGNALVAPNMAYVPEGEIDPPSGHMRYAGTISIPEEVFRSVLEHTARSLKVHGFNDILFIGDSGPNQPGMKAVSEQLNAEWASEKTRVHFISDWYTSSAPFMEWLREQGFTDDQIGNHGGLADTAKQMAMSPGTVRLETRSVGKGMDVDGVHGDPTLATTKIGQKGYDISFELAMKQIRELMAAE